MGMATVIMATPTIMVMKESKMGYKSFYNRYIKRCIDLPLAICLLVLLIPVYVIIALAIFVNSGWPIFYRAERGGYRGKIFRIFKFRTMVQNADKLGGGTTALHDPRITRIGEFLRKSKLDETAQLLNIIKGDMSFVGPRPELLQYTSLYEGLEKIILEVRPGITDYSSLQFINLDELVGDKDADSAYEECILKTKNKLRIKYAEEVSLSVDCKLFLQTAYKAFAKTLNIVFK